MPDYKISRKGIALIKEFEGCKLQSYPDPGTGGEPWTVGFGHTGPDVYPGMQITQQQAEELLKKDLQRFERGVNAEIKVPITQGIYDSLVSFAFNVGIEAFAESTLLGLLNKRQYAAAGDQLLRWTKAAGKEMPGLVRRRAAERRLYYSQPFPK